MPLTRPASPLFATDPTFSSGPEVGLSTRLDPGVGIRAQGVLPESRYAARWLNRELGTHGDWLDYLDKMQAHAAFRGMQTVDLDPFGASTAAPFWLASFRTPLNYTDLNGDAPRSLALLSSVSGNAGVPRSWDGTKWETTRFTTAISPTITGGKLFGGGLGALIAFSSTGATINYSTDSGATWTAGTIAGSVFNRTLHYSAGLGKYFVAGDNAKIYVSTTPAGLIGASGAFLAVGISIDAVSMASNGTNVLVCAKVSVAATSQVWLSTDAGVTWNTVLTLSSIGAQVVYNAASGVFVVTESSGTTQVSPTGASWTTTGSTATIANGFTYATDASTMASVGPAIVKTVSNGSGWGGGPSGIAYSLDLGATWNYSFFDLGSNLHLMSANNRLYALGSRRLWISPPLLAPLREV